MKSESVAAWNLSLLGKIIPKLSQKWKYRVLYFSGILYGKWPHKQSRAVKRNLKFLLQPPNRELKRIARQSFGHYFMTLGDFLDPRNIEIDNPHAAQLEVWRAKYGRLILLTFHMGNWELGPRSIKELGWPVTAVFQRYANPHLRKVVESRRHPGVQYVPVGDGAVKALAQSLRSGNSIAILGDQPFGESGIPVSVFGKKILWARGPCVLAVREKVPIVVATLIRTHPGKYKAFVENPLVPRENSRGEVERLAQEVASKFGKVLRQFPNQWHWLKPVQRISENVR